MFIVVGFVNGEMVPYLWRNDKNNSAKYSNNVPLLCFMAVVCPKISESDASWVWFSQS